MAAAVAAMLAGCGGEGDAADAPAPARTPAATGSTQPAPTSSKAPAASKAPALVALIQQRPGALIDKITVRTDGTGLFDQPSGGVGRVLREVVIERDVMLRLRTALADVPDRRPAPADGTPAENGATYILRYRGRTLVARQGIEPGRLRPAVKLLADLLVGRGIEAIVDERLGGAAGSTHTRDVGPAEAKELVFFQRQGEGGATQDTVSVRTDGTATYDRRHGGAGGRFKELVLRRGQLKRLRRALAALPRRGSSLTRGNPPPGGVQYLLRYRGRTRTGRQGGIVPEARLAVRMLDGYLQDDGVRKVTRETRTNTP